MIAQMAVRGDVVAAEMLTKAEELSQHDVIDFQQGQVIGIL
jgi:hypothetical protein